MNDNNKLTGLEYGIFVYFIMRATSLGICINSYLYNAGVDGYLCPIIGTIIGIIPLLILIKIFNYKPALNINEKNVQLFGKIVGNIINMILILFFIFFGIIIMWNLINFIGSQYLYKTPGVYISIIFAISFLYISSKNINVISRVSNILFYTSLLIFIVSFFGLVNQIKFDNLLPFLEYGLKGPLIGGINHLIYTVFPLFILLIIPKNSIRDNNKISKKILLFYFIANISKIIVITFLISIFGIDLATLYEYPEYVILRRISTQGFFQRFESILAIQWIFDIFIMLTLIFYYIKTSFKNIFKVKSENIILPLIIPFICIINNFIFKNNTVGTLFTLNYLPIIISIVLIPVIIVILIKIVLQKK